MEGLGAGTSAGRESSLLKQHPEPPGAMWWSAFFAVKSDGCVGARETREGEFTAEIDRAVQKISPFWIIEAQEVPGLFCLALI